MVTLQFFSLLTLHNTHFFVMLQQETELCSASAQFEDIVLEILNRYIGCFCM